eukprot:2902764-Rhodomonas_salina.1
MSARPEGCKEQEVGKQLPMRIHSHVTPPSAIYLANATEVAARRDLGDATPAEFTLDCCIFGVVQEKWLKHFNFHQ